MISACILVKAQPGKAEKVLFAIENMDNITRAFHVFGRFDIVAFAEASSPSELVELATKVNSLKESRYSETLIES